VAKIHAGWRALNRCGTFGSGTLLATPPRAAPARHEPDPTIPGGRVARARTTKRQLTYLAVALLGTLSGILLGWILVQLLLAK